MKKCVRFDSIELPAGILQGIFFSADRPLYLNFGGIGFIIGMLDLLFEIEEKLHFILIFFCNRA